jgi:hypothetical protein
MKDVIMLDDHEVNEIGRWYDTPIFISRMNEYMTKWLLTNEYCVIKSEFDEHIYFNYALNKGYINMGNHVESAKYFANVWHIDITPNGREFLNKGE